MKFKVIFILFNIVILFSILIVTIMPFFMLGTTYGGMFLQTSWYYILTFFLVLLSLDSWFIYNWKLLSSMEEERWEDMIYILEKRMNSGRIPSGYFLRIMINGYLMTSNIEGINKLGALVKGKKKQLYRKNILYFTIPVLLKRDPRIMESYFSSLLEEGGYRDLLWIEYLNAFSILIRNSDNMDNISMDKALGILLKLCRQNLTLSLEILVLYSLHPFEENLNQTDAECFDSRRKVLLDKYNKESAAAALGKGKNNPVAVILSKLIDDGLTWLFDIKLNSKD